MPGTTITDVHDVMTRTVVALRGGAGFKDIVRTMREWHVSALPVLDDDGRVTGVVSEADLLTKEEYGEGDVGRYGQVRRPADVRKADGVTAAELMTSPAVTVAPDASLAHAARVMARHGVKRLPVVGRDGALEGIVSRSDLLKVFLRDDRDIAEDVRREVVTRLFGTEATRDTPAVAPVVPEAARDTPSAPAPVRAEVRDGVVTLTGSVPDPALVPLAVLLARAVPGVVDVRDALDRPDRPPAR